MGRREAVNPGGGRGRFPRPPPPTPLHPGSVPRPAGSGAYQWARAQAAGAKGGGVESLLHGDQWTERGDEGGGGGEEARNKTAAEIGKQRPARRKQERTSGAAARRSGRLARHRARCHVLAVRRCWTGGSYVPPPPSPCGGVAPTTHARGEGDAGDCPRPRGLPAAGAASTGTRQLAFAPSRRRLATVTPILRLDGRRRRFNSTSRWPSPSLQRPPSSLHPKEEPQMAAASGDVHCAIGPLGDCPQTESIVHPSFYRTRKARQRHRVSLNVRRVYQSP